MEIEAMGNLKEVFYKNVGKIDRIIRLTIGIGAIVAGCEFVEPGTLRTVLLIGGSVITLTGIFSRCGLYYLFKCSTCRTEK